MILDTTTRSLQVVLAGSISTTQLKCVAAWVDIAAATPYAPAETVVSTNNTTAVTLVASPAASTQRKITTVNIFNADTASATVTVRYNDNSTIYNLVTLAIPSGYTLFWTDVEGWKVISGAGSLQMGVIGPTGATGATGPTGATGATGATGGSTVTAIVDQNTTSYTLGIGDAGKDIRVTNALAIVVNVPTNATAAFPIGTLIAISQGGAGAITITALSGVTLRAAWGLSTTAIYDARVIEKTDTDTWRVW